MPTLLPDLLNPTPTQRVDLAQVKDAITFAFASGVSGGLFADALETAAVPPSTWDAGAFAKDLFLDEFVSRCFRIRVMGKDAILAKNYLVRLLAAPPADPAAVEFRRGITAELLANPALRSSLETLYGTLCKFRTALEGATVGKKWDPTRRQLDVLALAKETIERMSEGFGASSSGLQRLAAFAEQVVSSEPYKSLVHLLQYDDGLATLQINVRVGADGRIRSFDVVSIQENKQNPFVASAPRRWLAKLELLFRGFRFGDGEVMARLIDAVYEGVADDVARFVQLLGDIEFYLGALGFADLTAARNLPVSMPELVGPDAPRVFLRLFNPLLVAHGVAAVPCDLHTNRHSTTVLITGPNSGGKTRLLQSIGLSQVLAQAGLFVPAASAQITLAPGLIVSLIQETRADQAEGRLGMELIRIRELFEHLPPGAMVILDELCSGTNPSEGEEIFELVVSVLSKLAPQAFITTHFLAFAARLAREGRLPDLRFLQVDLDPSQTPTYQFVDGVAQTSLAGRAAARLGVTGDQLLALVERNTTRGGGAAAAPTRPSSAAVAPAMTSTLPRTE